MVFLTAIAGAVAASNLVGATGVVRVKGIKGKAWHAVVQVRMTLFRVN